MSETNITILVSTVDCRILQNSRLLETKLHKNLKMLVVNQQINNHEKLVIDLPFITVINSTTRGLSKSRNIAFLNVKKGFGIVADDDVSYVSGFEKTIRQAIAEHPNIHIFTFQIETPEGGAYKEYKPKGFAHSWRSILRVSSISTVIHVESVKSDNIYFDERFGLGAKFPTGEENIFLNDLLKKGYAIRSIPKPMVIHPKESSGSQITADLIFSKGAMFRRLYGYGGVLFLILFVFKKQGLPFSKKGLHAFQCGINGFISYSKS
ncbi:hypothetical protein D9O36_04650 [Zobellia amurskyensis]|uniref:Glycosyl transferase family 2 n=1 Tax=Zobellia amurskyensis TaxID=248905 RepID=A0A7X3D170_9FLAO|nr:hypothetical protein [Zobellia amurskyensis]MUH35121.1 hypothetical protein [Zobellia amurskyensis]